nr:alpha/beta hydrolase [Halanaerobium congolense]
MLLSPLVDMVLDNPVIFDYERRDPMLASKGFDVVREIWSDDKDLNDPIISPLYDDLKNLGKISIFTGTHEALFPDNMKLDQKLNEQGAAHNAYVYPKMNHVFVLMPLPEAKDAHQKIMEIIKN